ncbi:hypothetical protein [Microbispora sp. GKU 823]|uniref:hypothetical protein n=1 Tax=Microbispora sp. GKU 823 TaxID=1652100 RepID=UPI0009A468A7|nr:hypothetical protein [Microbispora sp. GKU 823]OPG13680.1 hypothetical protein B1L11_06750 [Microbispora sp. GKU 823]
MTDTAVVRIQPDEQWLADKVGRHIAAHRDHITAAARRQVTEEIAAAFEAAGDPAAANLARRIGATPAPSTEGAGA